MGAMTLTSNDTEPTVLSVVRDDLGRFWRRWPEGYWLRESDDESDPESWVKVAGDYGPVVLIEAGEGWRAP